ncbi:MAG: hypothetical protein CML51_00180 [Rhodobacteraceae bacterium]|nr:hypothetical protein [Paracoccaceae bacterium]
MHLKKYLSLFLISFAFAITGCSSGSSSGGLDRDPIEDIDGDGIADIVDPDIDGDGIPNEQDPDDDNDGVEDSIDPTPPVKPGTNTCVAATILPPNNETSPGEDGELSWELLPQGCVLPATRANAGTGVTVRAAPQRTTGDPTSATANAGNCAAKPNGNVQCFTKIKVPEGCGEQFAVVYDISEVGDVLGDTDLSKGAYKQTIWHKGNKCETEPEPEAGSPSFNVANMRPLNTETETDANGVTTVYPLGEKVTILQKGKSITLSDLSDPRSFFDVTSNSVIHPNGYLNVYFTCTEDILTGKYKDRLTVEPGRSTGTYYFGQEGGVVDDNLKNFASWAEVQVSKFKNCTVNKNSGKCGGVGGYCLNLDGRGDSEWFFEVKKFQVE